MPASFAADLDRLRSGAVTHKGLVDGFLARIDALNGQVNALLSVCAEDALAQARALDALQAAGTLDRTTMPLAGMVIAVKDNLSIEGQPLTCGSRMLEGFRALYTATAVQRLIEAGAIVIGKANCDEFAMGSSNETSYFGAVRNPHALDRVPGGSSGGSAAAVAAGFCHAALGSDTGGSIRQPAAFCGVVGLKPTYGRVSRFGLVAFASSFDCVGPLAHSTEDVARLLEVMAGGDAHDMTSARHNVPPFATRLDRGVEGVRVGLPREYFAEGLDPAVRTAVEAQAARLEDLGATLVDVSLPMTDAGIATYYVLTTAEASSNLARFDGVRYGHRAALPAGSSLDDMYTASRTEGFGTEVKRRILLGTYVLSAGYYDAYYEKAQRVRTLIRRDFEAAFDRCDVLLTPATPAAPFRIGANLDDPLAMYLSDVYTVPANLAGIPGLVVPAPTPLPEEHEAAGLPVGVQLLGCWFDEATLLRVGASLGR
ncbi:MAG: Asp-tRNA(Asn)/Glu-tRNA(Gln) amidotransferase subunit GatA [Bacteroidota bacterium]